MKCSSAAKKRSRCDLVSLLKSRIKASASSCVGTLPIKYEPLRPPEILLNSHNVCIFLRQNLHRDLGQVLLHLHLLDLPLQHLPDTGFDCRTSTQMSSEPLVLAPRRWRWRLPVQSWARSYPLAASTAPLLHATGVRESADRCFRRISTRWAHPDTRYLDLGFSRRCGWRVGGLGRARGGGRRCPPPGRRVPARGPRARRRPTWCWSPAWNMRFPAGRGV